MLRGNRVLIAEDQQLIAWALRDAVEDAHGEVIGPVATVREGLVLLDREHVHAAILDVQLEDRDVTPIALLLIGRGIVVLFHTATGVPVEITKQHGELPILMKPAPAEHVIRRLAELIGRVT